MSKKFNVGYKIQSECCGCTVCSGICPKKCIEMHSDDEGFIYPEVDQSLCIECGLCMTVCPWEHQSLKMPEKVYALKSGDKEIQYASSSGGAFYELASYCISQGFHIFGASYSDDFSSVIHVEIDSVEDISRLRGSKYVQSNLGDTFATMKLLLDKGEKVMFSGTGCQVSGLKSYLRKKYDNLITVDILCHGVPSPKLFVQFIDCVKKKYGRISSINMKDKSKGWGHQQIVIDATENVPLEVCSLWYKIFYSRVAFRPSCYECKFMKIERAGDISLGDYWGIEKLDSNFYDKSGVSLLTANTEKGLQLFEQVKKQFISLETAVDKCLQPVLVAPEKKPEWREEFWRAYSKYGFVDSMYRIWHIPLKNPYWLKIRNSRLFRR